MAKILVVDDSLVNLRLIRESLKGAGYDVTGAESGLDGMKQAMLCQPALIFLDILMPDMNGVDVLKKLKETPGFEATPVVALTSCTMAGDKEKFLDAGFSGYLPKPVNVSDLLEMAARFLTP